MHNYVYILVVVCFCLIGCKTDTPVAAKAPATPTAPQTKAPAVDPNTPVIPAISEAEYIELFQKTDALDYIFYDLPFSMSQTELAAVQTNLTFTSSTGVKRIPAACKKALGRKFYKSKGEIIAEADMYFGTGCNFYVFMEGNKKKYANYMTPDGVAFYQNIIDQVTGGGKQNPGN